MVTGMTRPYSTITNVALIAFAIVMAGRISSTDVGKGHQYAQAGALELRGQRPGLFQGQRVQVDRHPVEAGGLHRVEARLEARLRNIGQPLLHRPERLIDQQIAHSVLMIGHDRTAGQRLAEIDQYCQSSRLTREVDYLRQRLPIC